MRTVTFSDRDAADWVNENYVAVWTNRLPKFHNCEKETERYIATHKGEIFATRNISSFVIDADGRVMHVFGGFYAPEHFTRELIFGRDVFEAATTERRVRLHEARINDMKKEEKELRAAKPAVGAAFREKLDALAALFPDPVKNARDDRAKLGPCGTIYLQSDGDHRSDENLAAVWRSRREHQVVGLQHLARMHRWIAGKAKQRGEMPTLDQVRMGHDGGDIFAEE